MIGFSQWKTCKFYSRCLREYQKGFVCLSCYRFKTRERKFDGSYNEEAEKIETSTSYRNSIKIT